MSRNLEIAIEVVATITLIVGVALTSYNIYPMNIYVSLAGNVLWFIMGILWRKWSLITIQTFISIIYMMGIAKIMMG
jgi:hypothetical protein